MAVTENTPTTRKAPARPGSKELAALARQFKQGYRLERSGSDHWRIRGLDGRLVEFRGRPISVSDSPSARTLRAFENELREAQVLRGTKVRITDKARRARTKALNEAQRERFQQRQVEANALRARYAAVFTSMGGVEVPGLAADVGHVGALVLRELPASNGRRLMTPDLLVGNATRMLNGAWVEPDYAAVWERLVEQLEQAPDPVGEWYTLVREARGLPAETVRVRLPKEAQDEWPFRVELLPLDALLVDRSYQRPVAWPFVRKEAARYDASLVGTIDVAQRSPSQFAILDGQQRAEIVRLVGKSSIWCSIYASVDVQSEARFFLRKNRDRKTMHPFYTFRASLAAADPESVAINAIVERHGYKLAIGAPSADRSGNIAAIAAVTTAYRRKLADGADTLDPTLGLLKRSTFGRDRGQDSLLIRGVSATLVARPHADQGVLEAVLASTGPDLILGRARDLKRSGRGLSGEQAVAKVLLEEHDRELRKRKRAHKDAA